MFVLPFCGIGQTVFGKWKTVDDKTGVAKAIVEIYKVDGEVHGKIIKIFKESERDRLCSACKGDKRNQPFEGLVIIEGLEKDGDTYEDGIITDPENGETYNCKIWLDEDNPNQLKVRGYISFLYRTQTWERYQ